MIRTRWIYLALVIALITLITVPIYLYNRPLGPPLQLEPPPAEAAAPAAQPARAQLDDQDDPDQDGGTSQGHCGGSGVVNILYLGQNLPETHLRGADAIRLMFVNYDAPRVGNISMPPDVLAYPTDPVTDETTLTQAFWLGKQPPPKGEPAALRQATEDVAQALLDSYSYETGLYMTMNQPVFGDMIDTLGFIWVDVQYPAENTLGDEDFIPGLQKMDGDRALDYVRILSPARRLPPEWARFNRQQEVATGIFNAIQEPENLPKLPALVGQFYNLFVTDLKPKELRSLYCMLTEEIVDFRYEEVTADMIEDTGPGGVMYPDVDAVKDLIEEMETWVQSGSE